MAKVYSEIEWYEIEMNTGQLSQARGPPKIRLFGPLGFSIIFRPARQF